MDCGTDFLDGLKPSLSRAELVSLMPIFLLSRLISVRVRSVLIRVSRPSVRPIVLPEAFPIVPRAAAFGSRTPAFFSTGFLAVLSEPIVRPIRDGRFVCGERWLFVADCLFVFETAGSFLPITVPMFRLRFTLRCPVEVRSDERLLLIRGVVEGLPELTAGCFAFVGAEELRVPIILPIRELWLVVGCLFAFETDGVLRLLEPPIREVPLERTAG